MKLLKVTMRPLPNGPGTVELLADDGVGGELVVTVKPARSREELGPILRELAKVCEQEPVFTCVTCGFHGDEDDRHSGGECNYCHAMSKDD